ncbi:sensor histidine kinase [Nakamurella lactea]|uniref:sensor histidine kinase n=1 Tax=Nakamurella lactea TaxID=459515 RepID=UPI0004012B8D|nr:histidine kinase [Nakamurella lactea]
MQTTAGRAQRVDAWSRERPLLVDAVTALLLAATAGTASVLTVLADPPAVGYLVITLAAFAVVHVAVAFRRVRPALAFVLAAIGEAALAVVPLLSVATGAPYPVTLLPTGIAYLVCAYSVSAWGRPPWPRISLVVGMVGALAVTARYVTAPQFAPSAPGGQVGGTLFVGAALGAVVTAAWGLGVVRRWRSEQVAELARRAQRAETDRQTQLRQAAAAERARIAREMHDVVAHSLSVMVRQAEGGRYVAAGDPEQTQQVMRTIADTGREALRDMRSLLGVLRDDAGPDAGSGPIGAGSGRPGDDPPQPTLNDLRQLLERVSTSGLPVELVITGTPRPLDRAGQLAGYRLVQEALTNVVKHAGAGARATVQIDWGRADLTVTVLDTGQPPPPTVGSDGRGRGQIGMAERLALLGGTLHTGPMTDGGYRVVGRIPVTGSASASGRGADQR